MAWLGVIRPHHRDAAWYASLWQNLFQFALAVGAQIPVSLPTSICGPLPDNHQGNDNLGGQQPGQRCGDIELAAFLADAAGTINFVMDMHIAHERWGSSSNPVLHGRLHYPLPADIDKLLNDASL